MKKYDELEKIQKLKESGGLTEEEFNLEKEKILNSEPKEIKISFITIVIIMAVIALIIFIGAFFWNLNKNKNEQKKYSNEIRQEENIVNENKGFKEMQANSENMTDTQKAILEYFDNDYFEIFSSEALKKYPQVFKNSKIILNGNYVSKIIKSDDKEYEVLVEDEWTNRMTDDKQIYVIRGNQLEERIIEGETIQVYGKYEGIKTYQIDGKTYILPTVYATNVVREKRGETARFDLKIITKVAKAAFGNDIKITEPDGSGTWEENNCLDYFYQITLDNQTNANFKSFNMDRESGGIFYNKKYNNLAENVSKSLDISADFEHFIVTTNDSELKKLYIDYFDNKYNKLWSREFDYHSVFTMDYNNNNLVLVVDNDLYILDINNGKDTIEPVMIGERIKVNIIENEIFLFGYKNKDTIMKVDFKGNILSRIDIDTTSTLSDVFTQIVNNKLVVRFYGIIKEEDSEWMEKYVVIDKDGNIDYSTGETKIFPY